MTSPILQHFIRRLTEKNYPTGNISYSLNYAQGDGMDFAGIIEGIDCTALAERLLSGHVKAAAKRAIDKGASIKITKIDHRYSHFNTISVDTADPYYYELTEFEGNALDKLVEAVTEDVKTLSKELEREGYRIHEAGSEVWALSDRTRTIKTNRFKVTIAEVEDEFFSLDEFGDKEAAEFLDGFVTGAYRYFALKVTITGLETGLEVGESIVGPVIWSNKCPTNHYSGLAREILSEAIEQARSTIGSLQLAA